jgi:hypothetical protein
MSSPVRVSHVSDGISGFKTLMVRPAHTDALIVKNTDEGWEGTCCMVSAEGNGAYEITANINYTDSFDPDSDSQSAARVRVHGTRRSVAFLYDSLGCNRAALVRALRLIREALALGGVYHAALSRFFPDRRSWAAFAKKALSSLRTEEAHNGSYPWQYSLALKKVFA